MAQPFLDEVTSMIDQCIGHPETGTVDFTILQSVLRILAVQINDIVVFLEDIPGGKIIEESQTMRMSQVVKDIYSQKQWTPKAEKKTDQHGIAVHGKATSKHGFGDDRKAKDSHSVRVDRKGTEKHGVEVDGKGKELSSKSDSTERVGVTPCVCPKRGLINADTWTEKTPPEQTLAFDKPDTHALNNIAEQALKPDYNDTRGDSNDEEKILNSDTMEDNRILQPESVHEIINLSPAQKQSKDLKKSGSKDLSAELNEEKAKEVSNREVVSAVLDSKHSQNIEENLPQLSVDKLGELGAKHKMSNEQESKSFTTFETQNPSLENPAEKGPTNSNVFEKDEESAENKTESSVSNPRSASKQFESRSSRGSFASKLAVTENETPKSVLTSGTTLSKISQTPAQAQENEMSEKFFKTKQTSKTASLDETSRLGSNKTDIPKRDDSDTDSKHMSSVQPTSVEVIKSQNTKSMILQPTTSSDIKQFDRNLNLSQSKSPTQEEYSQRDIVNQIQHKSNSRLAFEPMEETESLSDITTNIEEINQESVIRHVNHEERQEMEDNPRLALYERLRLVDEEQFQNSIENPAKDSGDGVKLYTVLLAKVRNLENTVYGASTLKSETLTSPMASETFEVLNMSLRMGSVEAGMDRLREAMDEIGNDRKATALKLEEKKYEHQFEDDKKTQVITTMRVENDVQFPCKNTDVEGLINVVQGVQDQIKEFKKAEMQHRFETQRSIDAMENLKHQVNLLDARKMDHDAMYVFLENKADSDHLERKVSKSQFEDSCRDLARAIDVLLERIDKQETLWQLALDDIQREIENKMDKEELAPLKNLFTDKLKLLQDSLKSYGQSHVQAQAAGTKKWLSGVNCISCDANVVMSRDKNGNIPQFGALPEPSRFMTRISEECCRKTRSIPYERNIDALNYHCKISSKSMLPPRPCGGSHTVTTPVQRVPRTLSNSGKLTWGPDLVAHFGGKECGDQKLIGLPEAKT